MLPQQYCLRWKYHHSNLQTMFSQLLDRGSFCDVTLACEGQLIRAHRVVLCACSTFFDTVLSNYASERDPIIIMKDVTFADVRCLIEFMYKGEINVEHAHLASLLKTADDLKIKGLAEVTWRDDDDGPTPPTPATEYHSPTQETIFPHDHQQRTSPIYDGRRNDRRSVTPPPLDARKLHSLPTLTPIPAARNTTITATASPIEYLGPKRKRGRPPLDDAYDVFNIHKLAQYASQMEHQAYLEAQHFSEETRQHSAAGPTSMSPTAAAVVYQQHVQQQQSKQRMRHRQKRSQSTDVDHDESQNPGPEWINSNLEVNIAEVPSKTDQKNTVKETEIETKSNKDDKPDNERGDEPPKKQETRRREKSIEDTNHIEGPMKRKNSQIDKPTHATTPSAQHSDEEMEKSEKEKTEEESQERTNVPQPVEEMESVKQVLEQQRLPIPETSTVNATSSRQSSPINASNRNSNVTTTSSSSLPPPPPPPPTGVQHPHFGKFAPEGYLLNEHGILMTHDSFVHAPTANIPVIPGSSASANGTDQEFVDIKMEDYDAADLRLTSEEMSQWQDVIKMDDYLAKGRRPQFWEEPFTRRVLDAIKNKRLEMKKAARILGVSYGTLYGRYREVYGCLKHPYSNSTGYRPSSSQLAAVQPRFDMVWPSVKREGTALLPGPLDIGKLRPKDLSELWARPQI